MDLILEKWQNQLLELIQALLQNYLRDRKVICIQDNIGGQGKSRFIRYLAMNEKLFDLSIGNFLGKKMLIFIRLISIVHKILTLIFRIYLR